MSMDLSLVESLKTGFVDENNISLQEYQPKLLINDNENGFEQSGFGKNYSNLKNQKGHKLVKGGGSIFILYYICCYYIYF